LETAPRIHFDVTTNSPQIAAAALTNLSANGSKFINQIGLKKEIILFIKKKINFNIKIDFQTLIIETSCLNAEIIQALEKDVFCTV